MSEKISNINEITIACKEGFHPLCSLSSETCNCGCHKELCKCGHPKHRTICNVILPDATNLNDHLVTCDCSELQITDKSFVCKHCKEEGMKCYNGDHCIACCDNECLPLTVDKFDVANLLILAAGLIEKSNNSDPQKYRWMKRISYILRGIENEWKE